jgi:hypothetical protein
MADVEQMLARRTAIAEEMTGLIGRLGVLVREEKELVGDLRREMARSGVKAETFSTQPDLEELINHELGRAGVEAWRCAAPWGPRLTDLVDRQHTNARALLVMKAA